MTGEELQRKLDELEHKRDIMRDANARYNRESDTTIATIRQTVNLMQQTVADIIESSTKTKKSKVSRA